MSGTRIRPDKQIQTAPGPGYVLNSDNNGELQFALLSALTGNGGGVQDAFVRGDIRSIDSVQLVEHTLVIAYTDNTGVRFTKSCNLSLLAVDVKLTGAILLQPQANTYILQLTDSEGETISVNLSDLLAVVTVSTTDIILTGNGTAANPLSARLSDAVRAKLAAGTHWTDEFAGLTAGSSVQLTYTPLYPFPIHVYRNGLRIKEFTDWRQAVNGDPKNIKMMEVGFGANGQAETVIVDYKTEQPTTPRQTIDG